MSTPRVELIESPVCFKSKSGKKFLIGGLVGTATDGGQLVVVPGMSGRVIKLLAKAASPMRVRECKEGEMYIVPGNEYSAVPCNFSPKESGGGTFTSIDNSSGLQLFGRSSEECCWLASTIPTVEFVDYSRIAPALLSPLDYSHTGFFAQCLQALQIRQPTTVLTSSLAIRLKWTARRAMHQTLSKLLDQGKRKENPNSDSTSNPEKKTKTEAGSMPSSFASELALIVSSLFGRASTANRRFLSDAHTLLVEVLTNTKGRLSKVPKSDFVLGYDHATLGLTLKQANSISYLRLVDKPVLYLGLFSLEAKNAKDEGECLNQLLYSLWWLLKLLQMAGTTTTPVVGAIMIGTVIKWFVARFEPVSDGFEMATESFETTDVAQAEQQQVALAIMAEIRDYHEQQAQQLGALILNNLSKSKKGDGKDKSEGDGSLDGSKDEKDKKEENGQDGPKPPNSSPTSTSSFGATSTPNSSPTSTSSCGTSTHRQDKAVFTSGQTADVSLGFGPNGGVLVYKNCRDRNRLCLELQWLILLKGTGIAPDPVELVDNTLIMRFCGFPLPVASVLWPDLARKSCATQLIPLVRKLHAKGVCHNDLHASNVLMDETGLVTICDFGEAGPVCESAMRRDLEHAATLLAVYGKQHYSGSMEKLVDCQNQIPGNLHATLS